MSDEKPAKPTDIEDDKLDEASGGGKTNTPPPPPPPPRDKGDKGWIEIPSVGH